MRALMPLVIAGLLAVHPAPAAASDSQVGRPICSSDIALKASFANRWEASANAKTSVVVASRAHSPAPGSDSGADALMASVEIRPWLAPSAKSFS